MSKRKKMLLLIDSVVLLLLVFLDQISKYLAVKYLKDKPAVPIIKDVFELNYLENRGAAFGVLQNQKICFLILGVIILFAVVFVLFRVPDDKKYNILHVLLILIASGGIGNMIDRIRFGYVVDFFSFVLINFPIFNVADICVTVSMFGLSVLILFVYKDEDLNFLIWNRKEVSGK